MKVTLYTFKTTNNATGEIEQMLREYCFCRGPKFSFQYPHQVPYSTFNFRKRDLTPSSGLRKYSHSHVHTYTWVYATVYTFNL